MHKFLLVLVCLFGFGFCAFPETLLEKSLAALQAQAMPGDGNFDFVVLGDTRATEPYAMPPVFHQMIREWNILQPAFVVDVGDLILGGAAEGVGKQWDVFEETVAECTAPFIPIPGNHDVTDPATEAIYTERIGRMHFNFRYGNAEFIALNTEEHGQVDALSNEQLAWLREILDNSDAAHIFVFMHKPYFEQHWEKSWAPVHEILKGHPVRVVFGCDMHLYRDCGSHDGIRYVVTGGGGAEIRTPEEEGGFNHYLWVRVRGEDTRFAVIRPGNILPSDAVSKPRIDEIKLLHKNIQTDTVYVPLGEKFSGKVTLTFDNPYPEAVANKITWSVPEGWKVEPSSMAYTAPPNLKQPLHFSVSSIGGARYPVPIFETVIPNAANGGPITVQNRLDLVPTLEAQAAKGAIVPDGDLREWTKAPRIPLGYGWGFDVHDTDDLGAFLQLQWDKDSLYLAVTAEDDEFHQPFAGDIVWSADNVQMFLDDWEWSLSLTPKGKEVFLYGGPGRERETVNTVVQLGIRQQGRTTTYEAVFPASELSPLSLEAGNSFRFSLTVNDLDPSVPERPRHWAELTPEIGNAIPGAPTARVTLGE